MHLIEVGATHRDNPGPQSVVSKRKFKSILGKDSAGEAMEDLSEGTPLTLDALFPSPVLESGLPDGMLATMSHH